jgi:hypothetical protein
MTQPPTRDLDPALNKVVADWPVLGGGSPDMGNVIA